MVRACSPTSPFGIFFLSLLLSLIILAFTVPTTLFPDIENSSENPKRYLRGVSVKDDDLFSARGPELYNGTQFCENKCGRYLASHVSTSGRFGHGISYLTQNLALSYYFHLTFLHHEFTPRNAIFGQRWELFLGTGEGLEDYTSICVNKSLHRFGERNYLSKECVEFLPCLKVVRVPYFLRNNTGLINSLTALTTENPGCNVVFHLAVDQAFDGGKVNHIARKYVIDAFFTARRKHPIECHYHPEDFNVVLHIRRGDVSLDSIHYHTRYIPNEVYWASAKQLTNLLQKLKFLRQIGKKRVIFRIFSEGRPEDFGPLQNLDYVTFCLEGDLFEAINDIVRADVFIGSMSTMTYYSVALRKKPTLLYSRTENGSSPKDPQPFDEEKFLLDLNQSKDLLRRNPCSDLTN